MFLMLEYNISHKFITLTLLIFLIGCNQYNPEEESIAYKIEQFRIEKDRHFKNDGGSPLLPDDKSTFAGLAYFPIDLDYRFEGQISRYDSVIADTILGTGGELRPATKFGYFEFVFQEKAHRLQVYKMAAMANGVPAHLFLGFTDETRGVSTYGGGRYIDLEENAENFYVVDFNMAYNPYCVYNPEYSCAIPSAENHLPFAVKAGEKNYDGH